MIGSAQAAKRFGVDRTTFNRWAKAGKVPAVYESETETGTRLFDADVIDALAARYKTERLAQLGMTPADVIPAEPEQAAS